MEALSVDEIPTGSGWQYEPKWDGFRCLVFRNGKGVDLRSKAGRSLTRYFPELVEAILDVKADKFAIDGEIVVPHNGAFSFDDLLQRVAGLDRGVVVLDGDHLDAAPGLAGLDGLRIAAVDREDGGLVADHADQCHLLGARGTEGEEQHRKANKMAHRETRCQTRGDI